MVPAVSSTGPCTATRCPIRSFNESGLSILRTLWLNSFTNTTCSPAARHFLPHSSWPMPAPLAPHFESLTHPFCHLGLAAVDLAGASTLNETTSHHTTPSETSFLMRILLTKHPPRAEKPERKHSTPDLRQAQSGARCC